MHGVIRIQIKHHLTAMAHLICVGHTRVELQEILTNYQRNDVENLMALGGDLPEDPSAARGDFTHALELVELARELGVFSIGVAAHPQSHPRSPNLKSDRDQLARKLKVADFAVTQFFFDPEEWVRLRSDLAERDVLKPVLPGIIPVTTLSGIARMATMGSAVPPGLVQRLQDANQRGGAEAVRAEGILAATEMCRTLMDLGAPGLHFYTMNRSTATREIHAQLFAGTP